MIRRKCDAAQKCATFVAAAGLAVAVGCGQTDAGITTNVKTKMAADDTVKAYQMRAGVVVLNGTVLSRAEADRAVTLARNTEGVDHVVDNLKVRR